MKKKLLISFICVSLIFSPSLRTFAMENTETSEETQEAIELLPEEASVKESNELLAEETEIIESEGEELTEETGEEPGESDDDAIHVLFLGNSHTRYIGVNNYSVGSIFTELAEMNGKNVDVEELTNNGFLLENFTTPYGINACYNKALLDKLNEKEWDYLIVQEQSDTIIQNRNNKTIPAIKQIKEYLSLYQDHCQLLLYETHGAKVPNTYSIDGVIFTLNITSMERYLTAGYHEIEQLLGVPLIKSGENVWHIKKADSTLEMLSSDGRHMNYIGYYIAAASTFEKIFRETPQADRNGLLHCNISQETVNICNDLISDGMEMDVKSIELQVSKKKQLNATVIQDHLNSGAISWYSLDSGVATVNQNGVVTAKGQGTTTIIAETASGLQAYCRVVVTYCDPAEVGELSFASASYSLSVGDGATIYPREKNMIDPAVLSWTTNNSAVVSVSSTTGRIYAKAVGQARITVTNIQNPNAKGTYTVYVRSSSPQNVKATIENRTSTDMTAKVSWSKASGAKSYAVYRATSATGSFIKIGTTMSTYFRDKARKINVKYYYKIQTLTGATDTNSKLSAYTIAYVPKKTTGVKTSYSSTKNRVLLSWTANKKGTGYIIYRSTRKSGGYSKVSTIRDASKYTFYDTNVTKKRTYYYRIRSYFDNNGAIIYGAYSDPVSCTCK